MKNQLTFNRYQEALAEDRLLGLFCEECGTCTVSPQAVCRSCGGKKLNEQEIDKTGTLRTFTVIRVAAEGMTPPFIVALVETDSGAWIMGNLEGVNPDATGMDLMGQKVKITSRIVKGDLYAYGDIRTPVFYPL